MADLVKLYQAKLLTPFAVLGILIEEDWLTDIEYLPLDTQLLSPTTHQRRVWEAIQGIPTGETTSYAEIAKQLHSAPRAVGRACGANRLPIIIPCHRVIAKNGGLGGFMNASDGNPLEIKRWLLQHEST